MNGTNETDQITPLYVALEEGYESLAVWLIGNGADVNTVIQGKTTLMMATARGLKDAVDMLILKGADVNVEDHFG